MTTYPKVSDNLPRYSSIHDPIRLDFGIYPIIQFNNIRILDEFIQFLSAYIRHFIDCIHKTNKKVPPPPPSRTHTHTNSKEQQIGMRVLHKSPTEINGIEQIAVNSKDKFWNLIYDLVSCSVQMMKLWWLYGSRSAYFSSDVLVWSYTMSAKENKTRKFG